MQLFDHTLYKTCPIPQKRYDNPEIHKEIEALLTEYTVSHQCGEFIFEAFSNGESLLACHRKIDLLFLDIELGEISGIDIVPIMQERFPDIIIIFVSSYMKFFISWIFQVNDLILYIINISGIYQITVMTAYKAIGF